MYMDMEISEKAKADSAPATTSRGHRRIVVLSNKTSRDNDLARSLEQLGYHVDLLAYNVASISQVADRSLAIEGIVIDRRGVKEIDRDVFTRLATDPRLIDLPKLLVAGSGDDEQICEALNANITNHVRTPFRVAVLDANLRALSRLRDERRAYLPLPEAKTEILLIETCKFRVRTPAEAKKILPLLAQFFPDHRRATLGITELLSNAIEHGNLELGGSARNSLMRSGALQQEIHTRLLQPEFRDRRVDVVVARREDGILLTVTDQGPGFAWREHLDIDPSLANLECGRGIARARHLAFDNLTYNERGNQAVALMSQMRRVEW